MGKEHDARHHLHLVICVPVFLGLFDLPEQNFLGAKLGFNSK